MKMSVIFKLRVGDTLLVLAKVLGHVLLDSSL